MRFSVFVGLLAMFCLKSGFGKDGQLQVYILAGQSNMEGHAKIETFDYIGDDPKTAPLLKKMRADDGSPRTAENVWISYLTGRGDDNGEGFGKLTAGYGSRSKPSENGGKIGPEYTFGLTLDEKTDDPILIIKTAWGGKSLYYDFRPPSAGVYPRTKEDIEKSRHTEEKSGHYYRLMMAHVKHVLKDVSRVVPGYDKEKGYQLKGFVWFQGWNDMVNRNVYPVPPKDQANSRFVNYTKWLKMLMGDIREELSTPQLPCVIGVMGVGGKKNEKQEPFRLAMANAANEMEKVAVVQTGRFWDEPIAAVQEKRDKVRQMAYYLKKQHKNHANKDGTMSQKDQREYLKKYEAEIISPEEQALLKRGASNAGYHYLGCAKTFALMGQAYADAILALNN